ncbi:hypothetical protein [Dankookia sp. P2]|uniref:hypothetical protein n=1 Tax=Dankookia sp. P2 TaxID=3423955 RepID=UPI003D67D5EF
MPGLSSGTGLLAAGAALLALRRIPAGAIATSLDWACFTAALALAAAPPRAGAAAALLPADPALPAARRGREGRRGAAAGGRRGRPLRPVRQRRRWRRR